MGYNKTILEGHLTRDIEMKYTQAGAAIANTAIAVSRKFKTQTGEQKEEVLFIDLAFYGRTAEIANQFLKKGSHVLVDGRLKLDQWTAQDGAKRSKHSMTVENLQMLGNKADQAGPPQGAYGAPAPQAGQSQPAPAYSQPAPEQAGPPSAPASSGAPTYNPPTHENPPHQGHPAPAPVQTPPPGQPGGQTPPHTAPNITGYAPNGAPIYAQPAAGAAPTGQPQQPKYQLQPGQEPGPGQYEVGRAPNGAPIVMNEDEIPF